MMTHDERPAPVRIAIAIWILMVVSCFSAAVSIYSCAQNQQPQLSPQGKAAYNALQVVKALDLLRDISVEANKQQPPLLSEASTREVVQYHKNAVQAIGAAPSGWRPVVESGLASLQQRLPAADYTQIEPYVKLLQALIQEVGQ